MLSQSFSSSPAGQPRPSLAQLQAQLESCLLESVIPFWLKHAIDPMGGINTCIGDDGKIVNYDKLMWSQCRAIYTFSALHNRIQPDTRYLDIASQIYRFCKAHGRDSQGRWVFSVDRQGQVIEGPKSIYADGFAIMGLTEYYRATGDDQALQLALDTYENVEARLAKPGSYQTFPYDFPPTLKAHGISMMSALNYFDLGLASQNDSISKMAFNHAQQVMDHFRRPELKAVLEFVHLDGSPQLDTPIGRAVVPGHAIESMWFVIHQYQHLGQMDRVKQAIECIRWHMERGWDQQYGGLFLGLDLQGKEPIFWKFHDTKLWWPVTEAMYALLLAHSISGEPWCLDWYWKVHDIAFKYYPVPEHGEWTQRLDRQFRKFNQVIALPVKDPFHLPRALILSIELLRKMAKK